MSYSLHCNINYLTTVWNVIDVTDAECIEESEECFKAKPKINCIHLELLADDKIQIACLIMLLTR